MNLDADAWRSIVAFLEPPDVLSVSRVNKLVRTICCENQLWERCCREWWHAQHGSQTPAPEGWPGVAMSALRLSTWPATYKALHMMNIDMVGSFWASTTKAPRGQILWVHVNSGKVIASDVQPTEPGPDGGPSRPELTSTVFSMEFKEATQSSCKCLEREHTLPSVNMSITFMPEGSTEESALLRAHVPNSFSLFPATVEASGTAMGAVSAQPRTTTLLNRILGRRLSQAPVQDKFENYERILLQPPGPVQPQDCSEAAEKLSKVTYLSGLWSAPYGGHGIEVLHVSISDSLPPEEAGGIKGPCVVGYKLLGDPNVPASKISFVASIHEPSQTVEELLADRRLLVGFPPEGPQVIDLNARNLDHIYVCRGQINREPDTWEPEWVNADLLTYKDEPNKFSVLWRDDDSNNWRHIIDFDRFANKVPEGFWGMLDETDMGFFN